MQEYAEYMIPETNTYDPGQIAKGSEIKILRIRKLGEIENLGLQLNCQVTTAAFRKPPATSREGTRRRERGKEGGREGEQVSVACIPTT